MQIEPLGTRVLIRPLDKETTTSSGIILPETAKEKPQQGLIEAVGDEEEMFSDLAAGDKVLFPKYSGTEIKIDGIDYLMEQIETTEEGCMVVDDNMQTTVPGIYAIGDLLCSHIKQAVIAASDGVIAAVAIDKYVNERKALRIDWN